MKAHLRRLAETQAGRWYHLFSRLAFISQVKRRRPLNDSQRLRPSLTALKLLAFLLCPVLVFVLFFAPLPSALTSSPTSGSLNPNVGTSVSWDGTAVGGVSNGES